MSAIPPCQASFEYSAPSPQGTGPLRLLTFHPSGSSTALSLSLVDAEQDHKVFTVSYAWDRPVCKPVHGVNGTPYCATATHSRLTPWTNNKALYNDYLTVHRSGPDGYVDILINGQTFYIQDTVYHLLQTLQGSEEVQQRLQNGQYFWLDAICINQNDKYETKQQTSNMHEIYKAAQHVYAWLGTPYDRSSAAMDFLHHLTPLKSPQDSAPNSRLLAQSHSEDQYWSIYFLFIRPYWQRVWVIQEFLLARDTTLLCGDRAVPCHKAELLVSQLDSDHEFQKRHPQWLATPGVRIMQARTAFLSCCEKPPLEAMIQHFLFSRSTFLEDKLIGLLKVSFSPVQPEFKGRSGSVEKRVEVIGKIVRASQDEGMDHQSAQEWRRLLECLLGVRGMVTELEKSLGSQQRTSLPPEPTPERISVQFEPQMFSLRSSLLEVRRGPATLQLPICPERFFQRQAAAPKHSRTGLQVNIVGSVRSVQPAPKLAHKAADPTIVEQEFGAILSGRKR